MLPSSPSLASTIAPMRWPPNVCVTRPTVALFDRFTPGVGSTVSTFITAASVPPARTTDLTPYKIGNTCVRPARFVTKPSWRE